MLATLIMLLGINLDNEPDRQASLQWRLSWFPKEPMCAKKIFENSNN